MYESAHAQRGWSQNRVIYLGQPSEKGVDNTECVNKSVSHDAGPKVPICQHIRRLGLIVQFQNQRFQPDLRNIRRSIHSYSRKYFAQGSSVLDSFVTSFTTTEETWLKTDEGEEAVSALEFLAELASTLPSNVHRWKWVIIVTHDAVQCFMVIALRQSDGRGPIPDDLMAKIIPAEAKGEVPPREKLDDFMELYKKIKTPSRMEKYGQSKHFTSTTEQDRAMKMLHHLRNEFLHFTPKGWSLEVSGGPHLCLECLKIIDFLVHNSGTIWFASDVKSKRYTSAMAAVTQQFRNLQKAITG